MFCVPHFLIDLPLQGGAALNVLSGLQAEVELITQQEGSWLFEEVFMKPPSKVLEEAIAAAVEEIDQPHLEGPSDLSVEQANLALRRRAMKAQCASPVVNDGHTGNVYMYIYLRPFCILWFPQVSQSRFGLRANVSVLFLSGASVRFLSHFRTGSCEI